MARLMDRSKMAGAQKYRHQMELMFRSSTMNEDKCRVLMYNNPPPDMNNWSGDESVQRYIPTIMDQNWVSCFRYLFYQECQGLMINP